MNPLWSILLRRTLIVSAMTLLAMPLSTGVHAAGAPRGGAKSIIKYRDLGNTKSYDKASLGQHIAIKVTPPKVLGPDQFVYVEIYNNTNSNISNIEFDLTLSNSAGYDLSAKADGNDLNKGWSALKKIATPGKGVFPPITKVLVENLKVLNTDATPLVVTAYVDLVRTKK